jgi:hypothetical protein
MHRVLASSILSLNKQVDAWKYSYVRLWSHVYDTRIILPNPSQILIQLHVILVGIDCRHTVTCILGPARQKMSYDKSTKCQWQSGACGNKMILTGHYLQLIVASSQIGRHDKHWPWCGQSSLSWPCAQVHRPNHWSSPGGNIPAGIRPNSFSPVNHVSKMNYKWGDIYTSCGHRDALSR